MMVAVVHGVAAEILLHERTQRGRIVQLDVLEEKIEAPCLSHYAELLEVFARTVGVQRGWIDSVAPCARTAEGYGGAKADALLVVLTAGVETVEPVAWDVAALDGSVDDVCVFHCTEFYVYVCWLNRRKGTMLRKRSQAFLRKSFCEAGSFWKCNTKTKCE